MRIGSALKVGKNYLHPFKQLYAEANLPQIIQRSLLFVIFGNICGIISGGSAITGYATKLGANDFVFGVLAAIPFIGTLTQIPAAMIIRRSRKRKFYMLTYGVAARAVWLIIGLVPYFIPVSPAGFCIWTVIFLVGISAINNSFINVAFTSWLADLVPIQLRGRWLIWRDGIISVICVILGLVSQLI